MISHVNWNGAPLSEATDRELDRLFQPGKSPEQQAALREDTATLWTAIMRVFDACDTPMTVRQVFYQARGPGMC